MNSPVAHPIAALRSRPRKNFSASSILGSLAAIIELIAQTGSFGPERISSQRTVVPTKMLTAYRIPRRPTPESSTASRGGSLMSERGASVEGIDRSRLGRSQHNPVGGDLLQAEKEFL